MPVRRSPPEAEVPAPRLRLVDLAGPRREDAVPILKESFTGFYRWHAKRTLREIATVRGAKLGDFLVGASLLEPLVPEVGYVYYIFVGKSHRRHGVGAALLDDAVDRFRRGDRSVVYSVATSRASAGLLRSRGFRRVERKELGWREGGLGAWGLRSRMRIISGETLYGRRLRPQPSAGAGPDATRPLPPERRARPAKRRTAERSPPRRVAPARPPARRR
jgi:ribosomal protein S18 acetylase RimI-like enzyme